MKNNMMNEQLELVLEQHIFGDEIKLTEKQLRNLAKRMDESRLMPPEARKLQESMASTLKELKKVLKAKGLLK